MKQDNFTPEALEAYIELQNPIYHLPTNLGIGMFKRQLKEAKVPKKYANKLIKAYKKRSWMEFQGISRGRGTHPVYKKYGNSIEVTIEENNEGDVSVKHK